MLTNANSVVLVNYGIEMKRCVLTVLSVFNQKVKLSGNTDREKSESCQFTSIFSSEKSPCDMITFGFQGFQ